MNPNQHTVHTPDHEPRPGTEAWLRQESLRLLRSQLAHNPYPGYPTTRLNVANGAQKTGMFGRWHLPEGPWLAPSAHSDCISLEESTIFLHDGHRLDTRGRPVHPWIDSMLADPSLGVVTGKGFYWHWGPNRTADPIIMRYDLKEPHVLLIQRRDTGRWALPGGFVDPGEHPLSAAMREAFEEAGLRLDNLEPAISHIYTGPLADVRATANAWPETSAFLFALTHEAAMYSDMVIRAADDAQAAAWTPLTQVTDQLFGSHLLLIQLSQMNT